MSLDLAIVTSCHNYGRYLEEWATSIAALRTAPVLVCIVDNGSTDTTPQQIERAAAILERAGIRVRTKRVPFTDFGSARNAAVALAGEVEWVQHLDADDMAMPHMLCDVAKLAPNADVIGLGYERCGNLKAGPRNRTRLYSSHRGEQTLKAKAPCSGVSPFRRTYWLRSPYRTDMDGGWDTALWISFAQLDPPARFVATKRPCFLYRQHAGSVFNTRRVSERLSAFTGRKLQGLRRRHGGVSVLVPWRPDGGARDRAWAWLRQRYGRLHPGWQIVESGPQTGAWRKGAAVADALDRATGDVLVIADADCVVEASELERATELVRSREAPWVVPHTRVKRLDEKSTAAVLGRDPASSDVSGRLSRQAYTGFAGGGIVIVRRSDYEASGGIPDRFEGWGAEDEALAAILDTLVGPHERFEGDLWHLWHGEPRTRKAHRGSRENRRLFRLFQSARGHPDLMWELVHQVAAGNESSGNGRGAGVLMVALQAFKLGTDDVSEGDVFRASEEEARRHEARPAGKRLARRYTGDALLIANQLRNGGSMLNRNKRLREERARRKAEHERRNRIAVAQEEAALEMTAAERRMKLDEDRERRRQAHQDAHQTPNEGGVKMQRPVEDKMLRPEPPEFEDKADEPEGKAEPPEDAEVGDNDFEDDDELAGVPFASPEAEEVAEEAALQASDFDGYEPSGVNGFTAADVRAVAERAAAPVVED
jgi:glycosyltransferase involved in cell wall biosynthesis